VLYFQRLKHGRLHACQAPEPWIDEWTANELDKKADHVISQECRPGTRRKLPIRRYRSGSGIKKALPRESVQKNKGTPLVVLDSDDEDNVPLARRQRLFQQEPPPHDVNQAEPMVKDDHKGAQDKHSDHKEASPHTPFAALVQLTEYNFD
ncbi:hypothetical protein S245_064000, partial [Arachis hypogaea]